MKPLKTKYNPRPANATETLRMLLNRTEETWEGRIISGLEESCVAEEGKMLQDLLAWRKDGTDAQAARLLHQLTAEEHGLTDNCIANAMSVGFIQGLTWIKNAKKFAKPDVPREMPGMDF
jgi:hypothetical protein